MNKNVIISNNEEKERRNINNFSCIPKIFKNNKLKKCSEEFSENIRYNISTDEQTTKEKISFLFPNLPEESINNILERSENNIERAISLIKNLKNEELKLNNLTNPETKESGQKRKLIRGIRKRNYNDLIKNSPYNSNINDNQNIIEEKTEIRERTKNYNYSKFDYPIKIQNNNLKSKDKIISNTNNSINFFSNNNFDKKKSGKLDLCKINQKEFQKHENIEINNFVNYSNENVISSSNNHSDVVNSSSEVTTNNKKNNSNPLDIERTDLIKKQVNYLLDKFQKMVDKKELESLLTEIGFPIKKAESIKDLKEKLYTKIKNNEEERKNIIEKYNIHEKTNQVIETQREKIEELTSTLSNLIGIESLQKMREERYKNELEEIIGKNQENTEFYDVREGY